MGHLFLVKLQFSHTSIFKGWLETAPDKEVTFENIGNKISLKVPFLLASQKAPISLFIHYHKKNFQNFFYSGVEQKEDKLYST